MGITTESFENPSLFSIHDRSHWEIMHTYPPQLVDGLIDILTETKKMTGNMMTQEIWLLADFVFNVIGFEKTPNINEGFKAFYNYCVDNNVDKSETMLFRWNMVLHTQVEGDLWKKQYGIDIDVIPELYKMNEMAKLAQPFLARYSHLEKIYLLEKLNVLSELSIDKIKDFIESELPLPKLKVHVYDDMVWGKKVTKMALEVQ